MTVQIPVESPAPLTATAVAPVKDDFKAALGHAYLQRLASACAFGCSLVGRHADGGGVDVLFHVREQLDPHAGLSDFSFEFQLRATSRGLPLVDRKLIFSLEVERYELLRSAAMERPRFLALLCLPTEFAGGEELSDEDLFLHRRGRWLCLSGAPPAVNAAAIPVRFPTWNVLTPESLREIARRVSLGLRFFHEQ